jgi:hypothetical protein
MPQMGTADVASDDPRLNDAEYDEAKTYYLTVGTERLVRIFSKMAHENPDVYMVISNGAWLSPWWLMHVDAVWMINAGDAASGADRTSELVYHDGIYYEIWEQENTQFPMSALFNHEPKKKKTGEEAKTFRDYLFMNLSRGTGFIELYLKTEKLSDSDWKDSIGRKPHSPPSAACVCTAVIRVRIGFMATVPGITRRAISHFTIQGMMFRNTKLTWINDAASCMKVAPLPFHRPYPEIWKGWKSTMPLAMSFP